MSKILKKYIDQLKFVSQIPNAKIKKNVLKQLACDRNFFLAIKEIVENLLKKNIPIGQKEKSLLRKYKRVMIRYMRPIKKRRQKEKLVEQSGGFLQYLVPIVLSLLNNLK